MHTHKRSRKHSRKQNNMHTHKRSRKQNHMHSRNQKIVSTPVEASSDTTAGGQPCLLHVNDNL